MKKTIHGKMYNTDTATCLASWNNGCYPDDLCFTEEELYRRKTDGEYFLYGSGGPSSGYAELCPDGWWSGGEQISPVSEATAREWVKERLGEETCKKLFGPEV